MLLSERCGQSTVRRRRKGSNSELSAYDSRRPEEEAEWTSRQGLREPDRRSQGRRYSWSTQTFGDVYRAATMQLIKPCGLQWGSLRRNLGGSTSVLSRVLCVADG